MLNVYIQNHHFNLIDSNGKVLSPRERERQRETERQTERESVIKSTVHVETFYFIIKNYRHTVESPA